MRYMRQCGSRMQFAPLLVCAAMLAVLGSAGSALGANMTITGRCYVTSSIEDETGVSDVFDFVPEGLDVRVYGVNTQTGAFIDYTDLTKPHETYRNIDGEGFYRVQAKPDLTFTPDTKEGFIDDEQVHLFIYGERVYESYWASADFALFYFEEGAAETGPENAHFTNTAPAYVQSVTATPQPGGDIKVEWLLSPSSDADKYLIFFDNGTGTIDYGWQQEIAAIDHPTNTYTIPRTLGLSDGVGYRFAVRVQDKLGSREYTSFIYDTATADSSVPEVSITVPTEGTTLSGITVEIEGSVTDSQHKLYRVEYGEGNAPTSWFPIPVASWIAATEKNNETLAAWNISNTREGKDGLYTIRVTAEDQAGNSATTRSTVLIDNEMNFITQPQYYEIVGGDAIQIKGTAIDPEFSHYQVYYGKGSSPTSWHPIPVGDGSSGETQSTTPVTDGLLATWDSRGFQGVYMIRLDVTKTTGVTVGRDSIKLNAANAKPGLLVSSPEDGLHWKYTEINVAGQTDLSATVAIESPVTAGPVEAVIASDGSFKVYNIPLQNGSNTITATVTGPTLNYSSGSPTAQTWSISRTVEVDTTAPSLTVTAPVDDSVVAQGAVTVAGTTETGVTLTVNGTVVDVASDGSFSHLAVIKIGQRTITITAADPAGNSTSETRTVTFDSSNNVTDLYPPVIELVAPQAESTITTAQPTITFRAGDDFSGIEAGSLQVILDGTSYVPQYSALDSLTLEATYTVTSSLAAGNHTLELQASDEAGNQAYPVNTTFYVDTSLPETMLWLDWEASSADKVTLHLLSKQAVELDALVTKIYTEEFDDPISGTSISYPPDAPFTLQDLDQIASDNDWEGVRTYPWTAYYTTTFEAGNEILNRKFLAQIHDGTTLLDDAGLASVLVYHDRLQTFTSDDGTTVVFQANSFSNRANGSAVAEDLIFTSWKEERQNDRREEHKIAARAGQGLTKMSVGYEMGFADLPAGVTGIDLTSDVTVRLPYNADEIGAVTSLDGTIQADQNQLGVFLWDDDEKTYIFGGSNLVTVSTDSGTVTLVEGTFDRLGTFEVLADTVSPQITLYPDPGETLDAGEELHFLISEKGSLINHQAIQLLINNLNTIYYYKEIDDKNGELFYVPASPHTGATVTVALTVPDGCTNSRQFGRSFLLRKAFAIRYTVPYPNPVRTNGTTIRYVLTQEADDVIIEIFDLNGDMLAELDGTPDATFNDVTWDLTDMAGAPVPNGSYIYRIKAALQGSTIKQSGKLSVLR